MKNHSNSEGFGMVDACLAVIVFGLILYGFLHMIQNDNNNLTSQRSTSEINEMFDAIISYYNDHQKLASDSTTSWPQSIKNLTDEGYIANDYRHGNSWYINTMRENPHSSTQFTVSLCVTKKTYIKVMAMLPYGSVDKMNHCKSGYEAINTILSNLSGGERYNLHFYTINVGSRTENAIPIPSCPTQENPKVQVLVQNINPGGQLKLSGYTTRVDNPIAHKWRIHIQYNIYGVTQTLQDFQYNTSGYDAKTHRFNSVKKIANSSVGKVLAITYCE